MTEEMLRAGQEALFEVCPEYTIEEREELAREVYLAMLSAAPPARVPLTDEQISLGAEKAYHFNSWAVAGFTDGVRFAERAHGIGIGEKT